MRHHWLGSMLASLMIAIGLSAGMTLVAMRVMVQSNSDYHRIDQLSQMEEQAAYAIERIARSLHQAGYVDTSLPMAALPARPFDGAVYGIDNSTVSVGLPAVDAAVTGAHLGSDVLVVRFAGDAAVTTTNCAGFAVTPSTTGADNRGISIFYVALDALNEPELRCKYRGSSQWSSQAIVTRVESFQVLFGLDTDGDGLPNDFVSASRLSALDAVAASSLPSMRTRIVAVHVALLMRSPQHVKLQVGLPPIDMFGPRYAERHAVDDPGTRIAPYRLKPDRLHRRYDAVIFLNNSLRPDT
jgi:type IV pilus assembly protein PilW